MNVPESFFNVTDSFEINHSNICFVFSWYMLPNPGGFAREAHGRLVFTERKGGCGWHGASSNAKIMASVVGQGFLTTVVNYFCGENGVKAIRLRAGT